MHWRCCDRRNRRPGCAAVRHASGWREKAVKCGAMRSRALADCVVPVAFRTACAKKMKFFRPPPLRGAGVFGRLPNRVTRPGQPAGRGRSLRREGAKKSADQTVAAVRERGGSGREAEHRLEKEDGLCGARTPARASTSDSKLFSESLILAQNERWQRGLGMQVERDPEGSNVGR